MDSNNIEMDEALAPLSPSGPSISPLSSRRSRASAKGMSIMKPPVSPRFFRRFGHRRDDSYASQSASEGAAPSPPLSSPPYPVPRAPTGAMFGSIPSTPRSGNPNSPFIKSAGWEQTPTVADFDPSEPRPYKSDGCQDDFDDEAFQNKFGQPPHYCDSRKDIYRHRVSWLSIIIYVLSVYSTVASGIWLVVSIIQPVWGHRISSRSGLEPSSASLIAALIAKTIEISFVTVFVSWVGQVLTRRAFLRQSEGMTIAEMTMRNWVLQPGSLLTHFDNLQYAGLTFFGALTLTATIASTFYTTASEAMVAPKLKLGGWEHRELTGLVSSGYANVAYIKEVCPSVLDEFDPEFAGDSCLGVQFSGVSYRNLLNFMTTWDDLVNETEVSTNLADRPTGRTLLYDNTTMVSSWIETNHSDVAGLYERYGRIINNVSLAMPHPGVYAAATDPFNRILQPDDLAGVGRYAIRAGVVSPVVNVMCVNMNRTALEPLVVTEWEGIETEPTGVGEQRRGREGWEEHLPQQLDGDGNTNYLNRTDVDDIFRWGERYERRPPLFPLYPADHETITNTTVSMDLGSESIYVLGKAPRLDDYTLCELRSWVSPNCSTHFNISGTAGARLAAHCEDPDDGDSYLRSFDGPAEWALPSTDWRWVAESWRLSMFLNGGVHNQNASNARIITALALTEAELSPGLPSMAEALAVFATSTIVLGSIGTPFKHFFLGDGSSEEPLRQTFNVSLSTQQYTSGYVESWHVIFYAILGPVFVINLFCLCYFIMRSGMVTDFTEPRNLFALAINSPPSAQIKGSCGAGPERRDLVVPWRVAFAPSANHYFFEEANERPWRGRYAKSEVNIAQQEMQRMPSSYNRLSKSTDWFRWGKRA